MHQIFSILVCSLSSHVIEQLHLKNQDPCLLLRVNNSTYLAFLGAPGSKFFSGSSLKQAAQHHDSNIFVYCLSAYVYITVYYYSFFFYFFIS